MTQSPKPKEEMPVVRFAGPQEWEAWLDGNHASLAGAWLQLGKKGSGLQTVTYDEAVEVALCYGWIDSQKRRYDEVSYIQKFTPRGRRSIWSQLNRDKVEQLTQAGRMQAAGLAAVETARQNGQWDAAYAPPSTAQVPDDLQTALDNNAAASAFFETLDGRNRYAILHRVLTARQPASRARRIGILVDMLARQEKLYP